MTIEVANLEGAHLHLRLLIKLPGDDVCNLIYQLPVAFKDRSYEFEAFVELLKNNLLLNQKIPMPLAKNCQKCEYRANHDQLTPEFKSGFHECWQDQTKLPIFMLQEPLVVDIWNFSQKDDLLNKGIYLIRDVPEKYFAVDLAAVVTLDTKARHYLQVVKIKNQDSSPFVLKVGLKDQLRRHVYPLHFIDFETAMTAIPFTKGRHPYEGIAFQFSHHQLDQAGKVEHSGQFLETTPGHFPNFDFIRQLKIQLEQDQGTIFRYATHENTYLNLIYNQLDQSNESDKKELLAFIESITSSVAGAPKKWRGERNMVDLCELVKQYYYDPATAGSVSIKYVLPAILKASPKLQQTYGRPVYGKKSEFFSHNFLDFTWVVKKDGIIQDPYSLLPPVFADLDLDRLERFSDDDHLKNGGAALMAYSKMQFTSMSVVERDALKKALLKYCELDTLAMVMVYQGLLELANAPERK